MHFSDLEAALLSIIQSRKRGRAAEGTGLLNRHICKSIEGSNPSVFAKIAALAQLVEQFIRNEKVASSIPVSGTNYFCHHRNPY